MVVDGGWLIFVEFKDRSEPINISVVTVDWSILTCDSDYSNLVKKRYSMGGWVVGWLGGRVVGWLIFIKFKDRVSQSIFLEKNSTFIGHQNRFFFGISTNQYYNIHKVTEDWSTHRNMD